MDCLEMAAHLSIRQTLARYCRGIDRKDATILRAAFHPDCRVEYGDFVGSGEEFSDFVTSIFSGIGIVGQHHVTNVYIEFSGDAALVESYFIVFRPSVLEGGREGLVKLGGRYLDRFEMFDGQWLIARRVVVRDWIDDQPLMENRIERGARYVTGSPDRNDASYAFFGLAT